MRSAEITIAILIIIPIIFGYSVPGKGRPIQLHELQKKDQDKLFRDFVPRIVGGDEALDEQFPYQAGLAMTNENGTRWCGGSLIAKRWVITAAHCLDMMTGATVYLGVHNIYEVNEIGRQIIDVPAENFIIHKDYIPEWLTNDVGLIKLTKDARISRGIQTISLPSSAEDSVNFYGVTAVTSGWGQSSDATTSLSPVLRFVNVNVISNEDCWWTFPTRVKDSNICTSGYGGKSPCKGDSGGPLVYTEGKRKMLIGIASFGSSRGCEVGYPGVFSRITSYLKWILDTTEGL